MDYKVIASGSSGNALLLNDKVLIDCGVSYRKLKDESFCIVCLTHEHGDHFNRSTVKRLAFEHPGIRWLVPYYLVDAVVSLGVPKKQIDVHCNDGMTGFRYMNGTLTLEPFGLIHDVPNCGYSIGIDGETAMYATDTASLDHIEQKGLDYYFVEVNYKEDELKERIRKKTEAGEYVYEYRVADTHLSEEQALRFIMKNARDDSVVVYMHEHGGVDENER